MSCPVNPGISHNIPLVGQTSARRESFGSVFPGSSRTQVNGNGREGSTGPTRRHVPMTASTLILASNRRIRQSFMAGATDDVEYMAGQVGDFLYLTEANDKQQVAYMATLLQDAAADWWMSLLKERSGVRPADFPEMAVLLQKRFGSRTRVDRVRADLCNIKQGQSESVRSYQPVLRHYWPSCHPMMLNGQKPSSSRDCTKEWRNWW